MQPTPLTARTHVMIARLRLVLVAVTGSLLVASCATSSPPSKPESMRDPQANFAAFKTFGWTSGSPAAGGDAPLKLLDSNVRAAIAAELQQRGYSEAAAGATPDLRIAFETESQEKVKSNPIRVGIGVGSWGGSGGGSVNVGSSSVSNYKEGSLVIHAIETARNAEVWQGRVSGKMTKGSLEASAIAQAVAIAMKDFPAH